MTTDTTRPDDADARKPVDRAQRQLDRMEAQLLAAIRTMREACDGAERAVTSESTFWSPAGAKPQAVLHSLAWGMANASTGIELAMSALEEHHAMREAKEQSDG